MSNTHSSKVSRLDLKRQQIAAGAQRRDVVPHSERMFIPLDKLVEDPQNERKTFEDIDDLANSLKSEGQVEPITVEAIEGEQYMVLTGHRRLRAARLIAFRADKSPSSEPNLEAVVRESKDAHSRRIRSLISNIQRTNVPPMELATTLRQLIDKEGIRQEELARRLGKDKAWISSILRILDLPEEAKRKVGHDQLSVTALTRIARVPDPAKQIELVEALKAGESSGQIRQRAASAKPKRKGSAVRPDVVPKPKRVYKTRQKVVVIVQSTTAKLTTKQVVAALHEALKRAQKK